MFPSLIVNYFGQGALALRNPAAMKNPFYLLAPQELLIPLVLLATIATIIASQATISGAFSVTQQATRLDYLPRMRTRHTSETERGQIYIAQVNWTMLLLVILLVLAFKNSERDCVGLRHRGIRNHGADHRARRDRLRFARSAAEPAASLAVLALIGSMELVFFAANATKIADGGWFPLAVRPGAVHTADHLEARRDHPRRA